MDSLDTKPLVNLLSEMSSLARYRCKRISRRIDDANQATQVRAAAARFASDLLLVASQLPPANTKESGQ